MTTRERQRRRRTRHNRSGHFALIAVGAVFGMIAVVLLAGVIVVAAIAQKVPPLDKLVPITQGQASSVYYADGSQIGLIKSTILRQSISGSQMPRYLREATVAIEDQRFYQHGAVDYLALARAALTDLTAGQTLQGGSTITMQLVRNLYLPDDRSFSFKVKEAVIAQRLEQAHSKSWILTAYLNTVPYGTDAEGQTAAGVQAASWTFFDQSASRDDLAQSALLAGLPQAPTEYNPFDYPRVALRLRLVPNDHYGNFRDNYFLDYVKAELIAKYGAARVAAGDLKVYTTIDPHLQALARSAIDGVLNLATDPSAALVSEDPANGYVDAMAQSGSYAQSEYNLATQAHRQPGSTFKAIVLADALAHGIDPFTTDYLSHTLEPGWLTGYPTYMVTIDGGGNLDAPLNLDEALVASDNTVFAQLAADLTEASVTKMAYAMGVVPGTLHSYPAEALGGLTYGVTPLEMANVYATIADGGYRNKQITITKVVFPDGHVDSSWGKPARVQVLSTAATAVETEILQHNVEYGTATLSAIGCPTAAKTGTTSNLVDAWLDGFTPDRTTVVWMGYPKADVSMNDVHGQAQFGGDLPAQIWHNFMTAVVKPPCASFLAPTADPMTYLPFSGHYQQAGFASYVPPSTGSTGAKGAKGAGRGAVGTTAPGETGGAQLPTSGGGTAKGPVGGATAPATGGGGGANGGGTANGPVGGATAPATGAT